MFIFVFIYIYIYVYMCVCNSFDHMIKGYEYYRINIYECILLYICIVE